MDEIIDLQHLSRLLMSPDDANVLLGFALLEQQPHWVPNCIPALKILQALHPNKQQQAKAQILLTTYVHSRTRQQENLLTNILNLNRPPQERSPEKFNVQVYRLEQQEPIYATLVQLNPTYTYLIYRQLMSLASAFGQYERAYRYADILLQFFPDKIEIRATWLHLLIFYHFRKGEKLALANEAIAWIEYAQTQPFYQQQPKSLFSYYLGIIYQYTQKDLEKAKTLYLSAIEQQPEGYGTGRIELELSRIYFYQNNYLEAEKYYKLASKIPLPSDAFLYEIELQWKGFGRYQEAIELAKKLCLREPELLQPRVLLAEMYYEQGDFQNALFFYEQAQKLDIENETIAQKIKDLR